MKNRPKATFNMIFLLVTMATILIPCKMTHFADRCPPKRKFA